MVCAEQKRRPAFEKWDKELNQVYQKLKVELQQELFEIVREDQKGWVPYRDYMSELQRGYEGVSDEEAQLSLAAGLTESRVKWLRAWLGRDSESGFEGEYDDGFGGLLQIVKQGDDYFFALNVVRGPTFHVGDLQGKLRVNGCLLYTSPSPRDQRGSRMPSSA